MTLSMPPNAPPSIVRESDTPSAINMSSFKLRSPCEELIKRIPIFLEDDPSSSSYSSEVFESPSNVSCLFYKRSHIQSTLLRKKRMRKLQGY
jgi:hypothetical protein